MNYLFQTLPKILFYPVYVAGWFGVAYFLASTGVTLYRTRGRSAKSVLVLLFLLGLLLAGLYHARSARYIFLLVFPITFLATVFLSTVANLFPRGSGLLLLLFTLPFMAGNTLKILHTNRYRNFAEKAAKKILRHLPEMKKEEVLLTGSSRDIGRIAYKLGCPSLTYSYPIDNADDLAALKEHFCDRYKTLILICSGLKAASSPLPEPFLSVRKANNEKRIFFYKLDLSPSTAAAPPDGKNLFKNASMKQPMTESGMKRIRQFFADNPEVLKIVNRPDFFWPYAWPFDHASNYFPQSDFDLFIDKTERGENAIHIRSLVKIPFFHAVPFPAEKNYRLFFSLQFLAESEVSVSLYLKDAGGRLVVDEELKLISGKAGEERTFAISVRPGNLQRIHVKDRQNGTVHFFFSLNCGDARFFNFRLQEL